MDIQKIFYIIILITFMIWLVKQHFIGPQIKKKNRNIYQLCIQKLQSRVKRPDKLYTPNPEIYSRFHKCNTDELTLTALANDILKHCGYKPAALFVRVTQKDPNEHIAGQYSINRHTSIIEIHTHSTITEKEILAILIHECMHFFLRCKGITMLYTQENEYLTDITTVYMGFYHYMKKGYGRVGYLKIHELAYINKLINKMNG